MKSKYLSIYLIVVLTILFGCSGGKRVVQCDECSLVPNKGSCRAVITKYYFDKKDQKCKPFTWGGCGGVVPFNSLEECKACKCR